MFLRPRLSLRFCIPHRCYQTVFQVSRHVYLQNQNLSFSLLKRIHNPSSAFVIKFNNYSQSINFSSNQPKYVLNNTNLYNSLPHQLCSNNVQKLQSVRGFQSRQNTEEIDLNKEKTNSKKSNSNKEKSTKPSLFLYGIFTILVSGTVFVLTERYNLTQRYCNFLNRCIQNFGLKLKNPLQPITCVEATIIGLNLAVWFCWRLPALIPAMSTRFLLTTSPAQKVWSLIGSAFSHVSFFHLLFNMYVFHTFVEAWGHFATYHSNALPKDLMSSNSFLSFYLSAAAISSYGSLLIKTIGGITVPSLGASGAVLAVLAYICSKTPDSRLAIVFIPTWSFTAENGLKCILLFDTLGLIFAAFTKWRYSALDHAGHLSGLLFGLWYAKHGEYLLYKMLKKNDKKD